MRVAGGAGGTGMTGAIDITDHPLPDGCTILAIVDHTDEFMSQRAVKLVITTQDLQIGIADAGTYNPQQRFLPVSFRDRNIIDQAASAGVASAKNIRRFIRLPEHQKAGRYTCSDPSMLACVPLN